jgi:hypothetical protein
LTVFANRGAKRKNPTSGRREPAEPSAAHQCENPAASRVSYEIRRENSDGLISSVDTRPQSKRSRWRRVGRQWTESAETWRRDVERILAEPGEVTSTSGHFNPSSRKRDVTKFPGRDLIVSPSNFQEYDESAF